MASSIFLSSSTLSLIFFHLLFITQLGHSNRILNDQTPPSGLRISLTRSDSSRKSIPNRYPNHLNDIQDSAWENPLKVRKNEYTMNLRIGTPPIPFSAIMDTGSDLIWTDNCKSNPSSYSSSFSTINVTDCNTYGLKQTNLPGQCQQKYEDGSSVDITLAQETFTIGDVKSLNKIFGCADKKHKDYHGVVGMGRGKLSLVSQLNEHVFGYCMGSRSIRESKSILLTGSKANSAIEKGNVQTMPLLSSKSYESLYYVPLEGISVGETRLPVTKSDFAISSYDGSGGMIIDSGTTFTYLDESIIDMIESAFFNQTKLKKVPDHREYDDLKYCFKPSKIVPKMVFHFEGANWELPRENYIYPDRHGIECLGFIKTTENAGSIFGNMQQQNMMVVYDIDKNSLSFRPANCKEL